MMIANNGIHKSYVSSYTFQNSKLQNSMTRLASGQRMITPGDAPADLGISERFRAQIRNGEEASRVIQNAVNMFQTTDRYLQEVNNILDRMSELAVAASDGSKSQADRKNLDLESQQLKNEVSRIADAGKYNGLQINGKTAVASYDFRNHKIVYSQGDGSDVRDLGISFRDGNTAANGIQYAFESSSAGFVGDYLFSQDGKSLVYIAQKDAGASVSAQKTIMKLDLESNTISTKHLDDAGGTSALTQARLVMDEKGRIWVSNPSTGGIGATNFNLNLLNVEDMSLDAGGTGATNKWSGGIALASSFSNFAVHSDYAYFIELSGTEFNFVKQSIFDSSDKQTLLTDLSGSTYKLDIGDEYAISADGQYLAFEEGDTAGKLVVINTKTGEMASLQAGTRTNSIVGLGFDANGSLYWSDTGGSADENAIKKVSIQYGDKPVFSDIQVVRHGMAGSFGAYDSAMAARGLGISVQGGSPAGAYEFQVGPDSSMNVSFGSADVRISKLGISALDVTTFDNAQKAITKIAAAIDNVANQRAVLGSQISRLGFIHASNDGYVNNITQAESRLRDVDIAKETSEMTTAQILAQTSISIMTQANGQRQAILRLLQ